MVAYVILGMCSVHAANLIVNGDFTAGNTGFTSAYPYVVSNINAGEYGIATNPQAWNVNYASFGDHTGSGKMMVVNGATAPMSVWKETVTVSPNKSYKFSAWIASAYYLNPGVILLRINGTDLLSFTPGTTTGKWYSFAAGWYSGSSTSAVLEIMNTSTEATGNDFVLDDLVFDESTDYIGIHDNLTETYTNSVQMQSTTTQIAQQFIASLPIIREIHLNLFAAALPIDSLYNVEIWGFNTSTNKPSSLVATVATNQPIPGTTNSTNTVSFTGLNITLTKDAKYYVLLRYNSYDGNDLKWGYTSSTSGIDLPSFKTTSSDNGSTWTTPSQSNPQRMRIMANTPTAIDLVSFKAQRMSDYILVTWETATEIENAGFHIWRSESKDGPYARETGFILPSQGGASYGAKYLWQDFRDVEKVHYYKLEDIDYNGNSTLHGPITMEAAE